MTAGGLLASKSTGVAPSTVMKKLVGLLGSAGLEMTSEKYSVLLAVTVAVDRPSNLCALGVETVADTASSLSPSPSLSVPKVLMVANGRCGSLSPAGPVGIFRVISWARFNVEGGGDTMHSTSAEGGT